MLVPLYDRFLDRIHALNENHHVLMFLYVHFYLLLFENLCPNELQLLDGLLLRGSFQIFLMP
jgi:hypothetical protein